MVECWRCLFTNLRGGEPQQVCDGTQICKELGQLKHSNKDKKSDDLWCQQGRLNNAREGRGEISPWPCFPECSGLVSEGSELGLPLWAPLPRFFLPAASASSSVSLCLSGEGSLDLLLPVLSLVVPLWRRTAFWQEIWGAEISRYLIKIRFQLWMLFHQH